MKKIISTAWVFFLVFSPKLAAAQDLPQLGQDPVEKVIKAMTTEEKVGLVIGTGMDFPGLPPSMQGPVVGQKSDGVAGAAGTTLAIPRLGIPSIVLADGPAGLRILPFRGNDSTMSYYCTAFPIATLLASSWDVDLVEKVGKAMGNEVKEYGVDILLAPALNLHRNPLGGRNFEYYSEDPLVSGKMAAAMVRGVQSQGVGTSLKHFVANNHEWNRNVINVKSNVGPLRELYLYGFEIAVTESKPWTVMSSYNLLNGVYTSESKALLSDVLRDDWGFEGIVMTDWFGGSDAVKQMQAGNDLLMPGTKTQQDALMLAVENGQLSPDVLDRNVENILNLVLKTPSFAKYTFSNKPDLVGNAGIARQAASEGMVLLKNENECLPLSGDVQLAVFGNSSFNMITGGTGSGDVNEAYSISLMEGLKSAGLQVNSELTSIYEKYMEEQQKLLPPSRNPFLLPPAIPERTLDDEKLAEMVEKTEVAIITIGRNSGEFSDRKKEADYYLSAAEIELIDKVSGVYHEKGKKVVIILNVGGVIEMNSWREKADAILLAWQPGQESGNAIADVLSGSVNPSGKLATTFPVDLKDVPSSKNFPGETLVGPDPNNRSVFATDRNAEVMYEDGYWVGYRYFHGKDHQPSYPFGYGMSYTEFEYGQMNIDHNKADGQIKLTFEITNTGNVPGKEVVQLYVTYQGEEKDRPSIALKSFAKTTLLASGASTEIVMTLSKRDLAIFDEASSGWIVRQGKYNLLLGASSVDIKEIKEIKIEKTEIIDRVNNVLRPEKAINTANID